MSHRQIKSDKSPQMDRAFRYWRVPLAILTTGILSVTSAIPSQANETRQYRNISQREFDTCIKTYSNYQGRIVHEGANDGQAEIRANLLGFVAALDYRFVPDGEGTLTYELIDTWAPHSRIWDGLDDMVESCT